MVWVNAMVLGAGGQILEHNELGRNATVAINSPQGREGAAVIQKLANSKAASRRCRPPWRSRAAPRS